MKATDPEKWKAVGRLFSDNWYRAPAEARRSLVKVCACSLVILLALVLGATSSWRHPAASAPGGVVQDGKRRVVMGWIAYKQEDWQRRRWGLAIVWGETWREWKVGERTYLGRRGRVEVLRGKASGDFTAVVTAAGPETGNELRRLKAGDRVKMYVDRDATVSALEITEPVFRIPFLER